VGDESALVVMGRLTGAFGIQGWVKVRTFTESPDGLASHPSWWIRSKTGWQSAVLQEFKVRPAAITAKLEGIEDRTGAELLRGCDVAVTREDLGEAGEGEFFWVDLEGLEVVNRQGETLGRVTELMRGGGADVLVVKGEDRERLIPFVADYVQKVDREAKRITVDWEAGYDV
jgi:16S rRNA processing protein RimM